MTRLPVPDREAPEGFEWVAVEDDSWRLAQGKRCRWGGGYHHKACGRPCAAEMMRCWGGGTRMVPWAYCEQHLYGRWIENGKIMHWIPRERGDRAVLEEWVREQVDSAPPPSPEQIRMLHGVFFFQRRI